MNMKRYLLILLLFCCLNPVVAQKTVWISGYLTDKHTGEVLVNGTVYHVQTLKGTATNQFGYFTIPVQQTDSTKLAFSYVGYKTLEKTICTLQDTLLKIPLEKGLEIEQVTVTASVVNSIVDIPATGIIEMDAELAAKLPSLLGEPDLLRVLQLMPGVQSGKEGTGGLYVRGGSNDQNLILLDGMPIFNANHIGGFVSVFNPSSINHMKLYKAGFPSRYGGRLSSILDIQMKNGNMNKRSGGYSLGTLTGSFFYEGPIKNDTSSFIISGRRTLYDLLLSAYNFLDTKGESNGGYSLWDINAKFNRKLDGNRRLYISFYKGRDILFRKSTSTALDIDYTSRSKYRNYWGNSIASVRLNKRYSGKTYADYVWGVSKYEYVISNQLTSEEASFSGKSKREFLSDMSQWMFAANFESVLNSIHHLSYGVNSALHFFNPVRNEYSRTENNVVVADSVWGDAGVTSPEVSLYFSDQINLNENLKIDAGVRLTNFWVENNLRTLPEPRFTANYKFRSNASIKFSYARMSQFIHLVSNNDQAFSSDFWFPSTRNIEPELSSQWSLGTFHTIHQKHNYNLTFDLYFKQMKNLLEQKISGIFLGETAGWEQQLVTGGVGRAYGAEILMEKTSGKTTGWLAYTLSKNERKFTSINQGAWYPFKYDRRHELSLVVNHQFNKHLSFHANWVFTTGEALSLPSYKYLINVQQFGTEDYIFETYAEAHYYQGKNSFRTPAYHRLDFNINWTKVEEYGEITWSAGLYNAYNSTNAFYYYFAKNDQGNIRLHAITLFPIMPSISYSFRF